MDDHDHRARLQMGTWKRSSLRPMLTCVYCRTSVWATKRFPKMHRTSNRLESLLLPSLAYGSNKSSQKSAEHSLDCPLAQRSIDHSQRSWSDGLAE